MSKIINGNVEVYGSITIGSEGKYTMPLQIGSNGQVIVVNGNDVVFSNISVGDISGSQTLMTSDGITGNDNVVNGCLYITLNGVTYKLATVS